MKTLIRRIAALLFCIILVTVQFTALAGTDDAGVIYATFNVTLRHNRALSRYGITVYFDGIEVAHLGQGDILTFGAYMAGDRPHELRFDADKDGVPDRVWNLNNLQNGSVLTCELKAKMNQVRILSQNLSVNGQTICSISPDTEARVRLVGTILATGIQVYQAAH